MTFTISNCGLKITDIIWQCPSSLLCSVNGRINREWQCFSLSNKQRRKRSKRIQMIKMVNEFKLTFVHVARPNLMQICAYAWIYRWTKNCGKSGLGRRAVAGLLLAKPLKIVMNWTTGLSTWKLVSRFIRHICFILILVCRWCHGGYVGC